MRKRIGAPLEKVVNPKASIKKIFSYIKKFKYLVLFAFLLTVGQSYLSARIPIIFGNIIDQSLTNKTEMIEKSYEIIYISIAITIMMYLKSYIMSNVSEVVIRNIRRDAFNKLQNLPISFFDRNRSGRIISNITNDVDTMSNALGEVIIQLLQALLTVVFTIVFIIIYVPIQLGIIIYISIPVLFYAITKLTKTMFKYFASQQKEIGNLNSIVQESIYGLSVIKLYNHEEEMVEEFMEKNKALRDVSFKALFIGMITGPLITVIINIMYVAIIIAGVYFMLVSNNITVGLIAIATIYSAQILAPVRQVGQQFSNLSSGLAASERVFALIDEKSEYEDDGDTSIKEIKGNIEFKNVSFSYDGKTNVLKNISFKIKQGETIAIVGKTGSGKTTIINLLNRFYDIKEGEILIDGININDIKKSSLRRKIGVVLQDNYLFKGTISDNIKYGNINKSDQEIKNAAIEANANYFIEKLPKGFDTNVENGGSNFSHGERQLISIARTLIKDPNLLILDEATSSVDTRTEKIVVDTINKISIDKTSFVIAHRLQTIKNANKIMVINQGKLVEFDNHDNLLSNKGIYYDLYNTQFSE